MTSDIILPAQFAAIFKQSKGNEDPIQLEINDDNINILVNNLQQSETKLGRGVNFMQKGHLTRNPKNEVDSEQEDDEDDNEADESVETKTEETKDTLNEKGKNKPKYKMEKGTDERKESKAKKAETK